MPSGMSIPSDSVAVDEFVELSIHSVCKSSVHACESEKNIPNLETKTY